METWILLAIGGVVVLATAVLIWRLIVLGGRVNLTRTGSPEEKPEWMMTTPPEETIAALQEDGESVGLYDYDRGERLAAPFAEQMEDMVRARLQSDPELAGIEIDFGTAPDGSLEIWVDGECYTDISQLPDERLRQIFQEIIDQWK